MNANTARIRRCTDGLPIQHLPASRPVFAELCATRKTTHRGSRPRRLLRSPMGVERLLIEFASPGEAVRGMTPGRFVVSTEHRDAHPTPRFLKHFVWRSQCARIWCHLTDD